MLARAVDAGMGVEGVRCVYGGSAWWVAIVCSGVRVSKECLELN